MCLFSDTFNLWHLGMKLMKIFIVLLLLYKTAAKSKIEP